MQKIYDETKASGVQFVGVDIKDGKDNAQAFLRTFKITYPSIYDPSGKALLRFRGQISPTAIPTTLVIDKSGTVAGRVVGAVTKQTLLGMVKDAG